MIDIERHEQILGYLSHHPRLTVEEAITLLGVSPATIRRDFTDLARRQLVRRMRGGVRMEPPQPGDMLPFALREIRHSAAKLRLAERAAALLRPDDVVIIDGGTTTFQMSQCLPDVPLKVITNSVRLAAALDEKRRDRSQPEIHLTGGLLYPNSGLMLGPNTVASLGQYYAQWAFLSAGGVGPGGVSNTGALVVEAERVMLAHAEKIVILADRSKLGKQAMCHVCGLEKIHILITDARPEDEPLLAQVHGQGVEVVTVAAEDRRMT